MIKRERGRERERGEKIELRKKATVAPYLGRANPTTRRLPLRFMQSECVHRSGCCPAPPRPRRHASSRHAATPKLWRRGEPAGGRQTRTRRPAATHAQAVPGPGWTSLGPLTVASPWASQAATGTARAPRYLHRRAGRRRHSEKAAACKRAPRGMRNSSGGAAHARQRSNIVAPRGVACHPRALRFGAGCLSPAFVTARARPRGDLFVANPTGPVSPCSRHVESPPRCAPICSTHSRRDGLVGPAADRRLFYLSVIGHGLYRPLTSGLALSPAIPPAPSYASLPVPVVATPRYPSGNNESFMKLARANGLRFSDI